MSGGEGAKRSHDHRPPLRSARQINSRSSGSSSSSKLSSSGDGEPGLKHSTQAASGLASSRRRQQKRRSGLDACRALDWPVESLVLA